MKHKVSSLQVSCSQNLIQTQRYRKLWPCGSCVVHFIWSDPYICICYPSSNNMVCGDGHNSKNVCHLKSIHTREEEPFNIWNKAHFLLMAVSPFDPNRTRFRRFLSWLSSLLISPLPLHRLSNPKEDRALRHTHKRARRDEMCCYTNDNQNTTHMCKMFFKIVLSC